jgi:hypothetical protein
MDFAGGRVFLLDEAADLAAGLCPRFDLGRVAAQESGLSSHGSSELGCGVHFRS